MNALCFHFLHSTFHHSINHIVLNINVPSHPAFKRKIWHYDRAQNSSIIASINQYHWVSQLGALAYDPNLFTNFIPNEERVVKARDPPWMTYNITQDQDQDFKISIISSCKDVTNKKGSHTASQD